MSKLDDPRKDDEFSTFLRRSAENIRPRAAFVHGLRRSLDTRPFQPEPFSLRKYLPQAAALVLLGALVLAALSLTPSLVRAPGPGQQIDSSGTAVPGQPNPIQGGSLPNGALARLGRGQILSIDVAPDGRLAVVSTMGVCIYETGYIEQWCQEMGAPYGLGWVTFNPAGDRIALVSSTAGQDRPSTRLLVLDAADGSVLADHPVSNVEPGMSYDAPAIAWDPSGAPRLALPGTDGALLIWDWMVNEIVIGPLDVSSLVSANSKVLGMAWALDPQGRALLAAGGSKGLLIVDTNTGEEVIRLNRTQPSVSVGDISTLDFSADGSWLAYGYTNGAAAIKIEGSQVTDQRDYRTIYQPRQVAFGTGPMANILAVQEVGYISLFSLDDKNNPANSISRIPSGFGPFGWDAGGSLYFLREDGLLGAYQDGDNSVIPMQYTNGPERIAWNSAGNILALRNESITDWDTARMELGSISTVGEPDQNLDDLAISADGSRAAYYINGADGVQIWDIPNNQPVVRFGEVDWKAHAAFSADNSRLVTVDRTGRLTVWDAVSGSQIRVMQVAPEDAQIDALSVSPNGVMAALAWYDGSALRLDLWNLESAQMTFTIPLDTNVTAMAWSPDSRLLAEASSGTVTVWDGSSGQNVQSMGPEFYDMASDVVYRVPGSQIRALAWSPDGATIATGGGLVTLWDVQQGLPRAAFGGHRGYVNALAFRADGLALASASNDGTILVWDTGAGPQPTAELLPTFTPLPLTEEPQPVVVEETVIEPTPVPAGEIVQYYSQYTVADGDTCVGIAYTFNVSVGSLIEFNHLNADCSDLTVGQTLRIPYPTPVPVVPDVDVDLGVRAEGDQEAVQALIEFLTALAQRDYVRAALFYGGSLTVGEQTFADPAALLQYACESAGYVCRPASKIAPKSYFGEMGGFDFWVTYSGEFVLNNQDRFVFSLRPDDQRIHRVVNLPPHP